MSNFSGYKTKAFSESQKFFVLDPNTGSPSFVLGSDLVNQITPNSNYVYSESTRTTAQATDYAIGSLVQTAGATSAGDNFAATYLVVASGEGDFPMDNGNELLVIKGDEFLREQLATAATGEGSDLVVKPDTGETVTAELDKRTIYVGSVAELEALSSPITGQEAVVYGVPFRYTGSQWLPSAGFVTPFCYGAVGDGVADDSAAFTDMFAVADGLTVLIPKGTYRKGQSDVPSNCTVLIDSGVTLNLITAPANFTHFYVYQKSNVKIIGKASVLSMTKADYTDESKHAVNIDDSFNVEVSGLHIKDAGADGIYVGGASTSSAAEFVTIRNCYITNCRRNGISVTFAKNVTIDSCLLVNMNGTLPEAGIDLEPNVGTTVENVQVVNTFATNNRDGFLAVFGAKDCSFSGCYAITNSNTGFNVSSSSSAPAERIPTNITLDRCYATDSGSSGFYVFYAKAVKVSDCYSLSNGGFGIQLQSSPQSKVSKFSSRRNTGRGVAVIDMAEMLLENSEVRYNSGGGLVMTGTNTDGVITGNTFVGNHDPAGTFDSNVRLLATDTVFAHNIARVGIDVDKPATGLDISSSCSGLIEFSNDFEGSGTATDVSSYVEANFKAASSLSWIRSGNGANNKGGFELPFTSSNAGSRTWRIKNDTAAFGDLSVQQATTQGGSTYETQLSITPVGHVEPGSDSTQDLGSSLLAWRNVYSDSYTAGGSAGVSGTFTTNDGKTVTVTSGIITSIV